MTGICRLVWFAAHWHRRQKRGVGFHQNAILGRGQCNFANNLGITKSQDAGKTDIEADVNGTARQFRSRAEAMQHPGKSAFPHLVLNYICDVRISLAGMNDDGQIQFARRRDLGAKALSLTVARRIIIMIIQSGLANGNAFGVIRSLDKGIDIAGIFFIAGLMWMDTDAEPYIIMGFGYAAWLVSRCQLYTD